MAQGSIRYIVDDVDAAVDFYTRHLGFEIEMRPAPGFASLVRDGLRLLLNAPGAGGAGNAGPDGARVAPGGSWNRFQLQVSDLPDTIETLREAGFHTYGPVAHGRGGDQVLLQDPSGNLIELFQPAGSRSG